MQITGLIQKLINAGVVEKHSEGLAFTFGFDSYLAWHADRNRAKTGAIEDWSDMLNGYNRSLEALSAEEISAIIVLLQYTSESEEKAPAH